MDGLEAGRSGSPHLEGSRPCGGLGCASVLLFLLCGPGRRRPACPCGVQTRRDCPRDRSTRPEWRPHSHLEHSSLPGVQPGSDGRERAGPSRESRRPDFADDKRQLNSRRQTGLKLGHPPPSVLACRRQSSPPKPAEVPAGCARSVTCGLETRADRRRQRRWCCSSFGKRKICYGGGHPPKRHGNVARRRLRLIKLKKWTTTTSTKGEVFIE